MSLNLKNDLGTIMVEDNVVAMIAGRATLDCYGLVGMVSRNALKDGIIDLLGRENISRGVEVRKVGEETHVDIYVIVAYGTKISEVANNVQSTVKYTLENTLGYKVDVVNIFVQGVRVVNA